MKKEDVSHATKVMPFRKKLLLLSDNFAWPRIAAESSRKNWNGFSELCTLMTNDDGLRLLY